ncbi:peptidoglycan DD-metalloendopeptidase family protein [Agromyces aurantiacus]|uniref:Peptidoglycan DD-metalloendopeptidase family protein n=1 Tax=Agromyces aurantiacus TaxID=165814 RepID=A0ABV9R5K5_9MICO|nr:peptidoglycan DD-metalloendopeptidase family protein [Agromyces aurantiacus]MBM7503298.1 murein DD-endopeptidase MepM/ murein hydrolase activator NlpD [Agromyces aurantiacus]
MRAAQRPGEYPHPHERAHPDQRARADWSPHPDQRARAEQTPHFDQRARADRSPQSDQDQSPHPDQRTRADQSPHSGQRRHPDQPAAPIPGAARPQADRFPTRDQLRPAAGASAAAVPPGAVPAAGPSPRLDERRPAPAGPAADRRAAEIVRSDDASDGRARLRLEADPSAGMGRDLRADSADDFAAMFAAATGGEGAARAGLEFRDVAVDASAASRTSPVRRGPGADRSARRADAAAATSGPRRSSVERPAGGAASVSKPAPRRSVRRAVTTRIVSTVAMGFAAMLAIATSVPSLSLLSPEDVQALALSNAAGTTVDGQRVDIAGGTLAASVDRQDYEHQTLEEYARAAGIRPEATFTNNPLGTIQWPFAVGVHIGDHFGYRNCAGCSMDHHGQDFNPGLGAEIQAIADGTVSVSTDDGGSLGVVMMIDHVIDGEVVTSVYAHMEYGSRRFEVGDTVKVADVVGTTGNTGMSTGPHLHFEIRIGGVDGYWVDPLEWLYANTN